MNNTKPFPFHRICVVGTTGSGKSTLASELSRRMQLPHVELDSLYWGPNWTACSYEEMRLRAGEATRGDKWVVDGNYSSIRDLTWPRAEAVVWLDYPLALILWQLWKRTWKRGLTKESLWGTNKERLWPQFFSKDSLFLWAVKTYKRRKQN
jgi:adenylate kinase family enzyme